MKIRLIFFIIVALLRENIGNEHGCIRFMIQGEGKPLDGFLMGNRVEILRTNKNSVDLIACKQDIARIMKLVQNGNYSYQVDLNIERRGRRQMRETVTANTAFYRAKRESEKGRLHTFYPSFDLMKRLLQEADKKFSTVTYRRFGTTWEQREMFLIEIAKNKSLPVIWIDGCIHAREWIGPASVLYFIDHLVSGKGDELLKKYKFFIAPVLNPDGYEYSQTKNRFWRKNRRILYPQSLHSNCNGVDLNRNFPAIYAKPEMYDILETWSENYPGKSALSEPETKAIAQELRRIASMERFQASISFHSYGQIIRLPRGFKGPEQFSDNFNENMAAGMHMVRDLQEKQNVEYQIGNMVDIMYEAYGSLGDFVSVELNPPYIYGVELPGPLSDPYLFMLPPTSIVSGGKQVVQIIETLVRVMKPIKV